MRVRRARPSWSVERLMLEERLDAVEAFERSLVKRRLTPRSRSFIFPWITRILRAVIAVVIGMNVAVAAMLVTFFVFAKLLHITF